MRIEICVDSLEGALAAERGGADRVELCASLIEGGTTPSAGMIQLCRKSLSIGLHVLIRPRAGDFLYSDLELQVMHEEIRAAKSFGCDGVVFGCLTADGAIDTHRTGELIESARPLSVTFHRAFDLCRDPRQSLEQLIQLRVDRLLTSGQENSCLEGLPLIAGRLWGGRLWGHISPFDNCRSIRARDRRNADSSLRRRPNRLTAAPAAA